MLCTKCGRVITDNSIFCPFCGNSGNAPLSPTPSSASNPYAAGAHPAQQYPLYPSSTAPQGYQQNAPQTTTPPPQHNSYQSDLSFTQNVYQPPFYNAQPPYPPIQNVAYPENSGQAIASLVLGIVGLIFWLLPLLGLPITIVGLVMGTKGRRNSLKPAMATVGMVLSMIGLVLTAINMFLGALFSTI